jgi:hypothetical protein
MAINEKLDCTRLLPDDELMPHLLQRHTLIFKGLGKEWQEIERQVERLGFGETYFVSQLGVQECSTKLTPATSCNA